MKGNTEENCSKKRHIQDIWVRLEFEHKMTLWGVPFVAQWLTNPTRNHEVAGSVPGLAQWVKVSGVSVRYSVGRRCSSDPELLWLSRRLVATAPIRPLAWEPPSAAGAALEKAKRQKKKKSESQKNLSLVLVVVFVLWKLACFVVLSDP